MLLSQSSSAQEYVPGQLIVKFRTGISKAERASINKEIGARIIKEIRLIEAHLVKITAPITVERAIELYVRNPDVEYAHPNYILYARGHLTRPDDPDFPKQWGLDNKGQEILSSGKGRIDADMPSGVTLSVELEAPAGSLSKGPIIVSTTPKSLVADISKVADKNLGLTYMLFVDGNVEKSQRVLTLTLTDGL